MNTNRRIRKVKALVTGQESADDIHVVNVANTAVTIRGEASSTAMALYLPRLGGVLAACPMDESVTYKALEDLASAEPVEDVDASIDGGDLVLFADDDAVRIARGVNTLQTITGDLTEDMKKIAVVEAMDLIQEDIIRTFKAYYLGKRKNTADNQALFVADILAYLTSLSEAGRDLPGRPHHGGDRRGRYAGGMGGHWDGHLGPERRPSEKEDVPVFGVRAGPGPHPGRHGGPVHDLHHGLKGGSSMRHLTTTKSSAGPSARSGWTGSGWPM